MYRQNLKTLFALSSFCTFSSVLAQSSTRPNIILIMADDMGFSDIGCYGSEIETPNIDKLAHKGLRFTQFYNMAKSNPTRSSLLTGRYWGGNGAVNLGYLAKKANYYTLYAGKEHFDKWIPQNCRSKSCFNHSLYYWLVNEYFVPPSGEYSHPFVLDGDTLKAKDIKHQISPKYKTDFITDYALKWIEEGKASGKPIYLYLPYHVAHYPLQARPEDIEKYKGRYLKGWDEVRKERFKRIKDLGLISKTTKLSPPKDNINRSRKEIKPEYENYYPWNSLNKRQKEALDLEMAVFAAMVDRMDQNIGRILNKLKELKMLNNTLILYLQDNGSCPYYTNHIKDVPPGPANSFWSLRTAWANVGNTPFKYYKQYGYEGGCRTPFIAYWPAKIKANTITTQVGHVVDIVPTLLHYFETNYPDSIEKYQTLRLQGTSLAPILEGRKRREPLFFISGSKEKLRMYREGNYKIVQLMRKGWQLYNLKEDPTELNDLSKKEPYRLQKMLKNYQRIKSLKKKK